MFERFLFMFHIFVANETGGIDRIDSRFVFPNEEACRIVEAFVHDTTWNLDKAIPKDIKTKKIVV